MRSCKIAPSPPLPFGLSFLPHLGLTSRKPEKNKHMPMKRYVAIPKRSMGLPDMPISWGGATGVNAGIYSIHGVSGIFYPHVVGDMNVKTSPNPHTLAPCSNGNWRLGSDTAMPSGTCGTKWQSSIQGSSKSRCLNKPDEPPVSEPREETRETDRAAIATIAAYSGYSSVCRTTQRKLNGINK